MIVNVSNIAEDKTSFKTNIDLNKFVNYKVSWIKWIDIWKSNQIVQSLKAVKGDYWYKYCTLLVGGIYMVKRLLLILKMLMRLMPPLNY
ncbi:MAG: hypothetical protein ACTS5A_00655 [Candidatus Hodgkinia cicadicola]